MIADSKMDPVAFKQATRVQWDKAAAGCDRHAPKNRDWLRVPTDAMLEMAGINPGQTVLDVAAGAGDQTLDIAVRVGADGKVVATDISEGILNHAFGNAARAGHANVHILPPTPKTLASMMQHSTPQSVASG